MLLLLISVFHRFNVDSFPSPSPPLPNSVGPRPGLPRPEPLAQRRRLPGPLLPAAGPRPGPAPLRPAPALHRGGAAADALAAGRRLRPGVAHLAWQRAGRHPPGGRRRRPPPPAGRQSAGGPRLQGLGLVPPAAPQLLPRGE